MDFMPTWGDAGPILHLQQAAGGAFAQTGGALRSLAMRRLMYVAAETGARFVRERSPVEPIDWLFMPRELFDGRAAVEVCQHQEGFRRAIALHGLSIGLDAAPASVAGIPSGEFLSRRARASLAMIPPRGHHEHARRPRGRPALFTGTIATELDDYQVQIFYAMIACGAEEVRFRLRQRFGPLLEEEAVVRRGFDWSEPLACAMVSEAMAHLLMLAAEEPTSALAQGLDFQVEQRFSS